MVNWEFGIRVQVWTKLEIIKKLYQEHLKKKLSEERFTCNLWGYPKLLKECRELNSHAKKREKCGLYEAKCETQDEDLPTKKKMRLIFLSNSANEKFQTTKHQSVNFLISS